MAINFPDSPSLNDTYVAGGKTYKWDGTAWEIYGPNVSPGTFKIDDVNNRVGINNASPTVDLDVTGDVNISGELTSRGYRYVQTVYFTSDGTFTKASYPWLRAVRVKCQGGGASGGGTDYIDTNGDVAAAPGGGGGGYAESFITDIASLAASVTVTVGSGGTGGAGGTSGTPNGGDGVAGGASSFGSGTAYEVIGNGGDNSSRGPEVSDVYVTGRATTAGGTGDLVIPGRGSAHSIVIGGDVATNFRVAMPSAGGDSHLGAGGANPNNGTTTGNFVRAGYDGQGYGGGGGGGYAAAKTGAPFDGGAGGDGADGIVIVELYA